LRMDIAAGSPVSPTKNVTPNTAPTSLDDDPRYRTNFSDQARVWGGDPVAPGTFPDAVAITGNGKICSGIVIGAQAVLTAAHCFCGGVKQTVYFGDTIQQATSTASVSGGNAMIPCEPNLQLQNGDVAIVRTSALLTIPPRAFASAALINSATFGSVVGFGIGMNPVIDPAGIKRLVDVPMASVSCTGSVTTRNGLVADSSYYHCASGRELVAGAQSLDKDSCNGDSGGPLYVLSQDGSLYLAATTSRPTGTPGMRPCGDGGIYVRTDGAILQWIQSQGIQIFVGPSR
jgi:secreted trypsin-like serine protease